MRSEEKVIDAEFEEVTSPPKEDSADEVTRKAAEKFIPSKAAKVACDVLDAVEKPLRRVSAEKADTVAATSAHIKGMGEKADESIRTAIEVQEEVKGVAAALKEAAPHVKEAWNTVKEGAKKAGEFIGKMDQARGSGRFRRKIF